MRCCSQYFFQGTLKNNVKKGKIKKNIFLRKIQKMKMKKCPRKRLANSLESLKISASENETVSPKRFLIRDPYFNRTFPTKANNFFSFEVCCSASLLPIQSLTVC